MILRRNVASQTVAIGPFLDGSNQPIESGVSATVNESAASGTLTHTVGGCYTYTFTQGETANSIVRLRLSFSQRAICKTFATMALDASGQIVAQGVADIESLGLKVRYIQDQNGNAHEIAQSGNDDSVYELDVSGIATTVEAIQQAVLQSNTVTEVDSQTIKLKVASTKAKTHYVTGNLTGKTLKLYVESKPGIFFAEFTATGANGSFSFTPSSTLTEKTRTFPAALREPSDGNNVLWSGNIEVAYAADAE